MYILTKIENACYFNTHCIHVYVYTYMYTYIQTNTYLDKFAIGKDMQHFALSNLTNDQFGLKLILAKVLYIFLVIKFFCLIILIFW
jgi:hypothetical protein